MAFALQQRLLQMMAHGISSRADVDDLSTGDWAQLLMIVRQHRLGPLLHYRLTEGGALEHIAKPFADSIAATFEKSAARAVELRVEIARVQRVLRESEVPAVFLRGAYLAFHVYPHHALRPVRTLDVLVPEAQAADAHHALKSSPFSRRSGGRPEPAQSRSSVEMHTRLTDSGPWRMVRRLDPAFQAGTWNRLICSVMGEEEIWFLSPEDQLMNLVVHSLYAERRNCGPLVLTDIAGLLGHSVMDWPLFWRLADNIRQVAAAWLLLAITRHYYPGINFMPPQNAQPPALPADLATVAVPLLLGKPQERLATWRDLKLQTRNRPLHFVMELLAG
jgi:hypothetical protein